MNRSRLSRPSLKITHQVDPTESDDFTFEVWSPFTGSYQSVVSVQEGLRRIGELAALICQMWLQRHPKQHDLTDAPVSDVGNTVEWAEFRVNPTTHRSYDTRRHDRPAWTRALGISQAVELTCTRVGCALPAVAA